MKKVMEVGGNNIKKIIKGSVLSIFITLFSLIGFALVLTYTNLNENTIPIVIIILAGISVLIGSILSTLHVKKNGIINGILVGGIYILVLYIMSSVLTGRFELNKSSLIMTIVAMCSGAIGGIIGVNKSK